MTNAPGTRGGGAVATTFLRSASIPPAHQPNGAHSHRWLCSVLRLEGKRTGALQLPSSSLFKTEQSWISLRGKGGQGRSPPLTHLSRQLSAQSHSLYSLKPNGDLFNLYFFKNSISGCPGATIMVLAPIAESSACY